MATAGVGLGLTACDRGLEITEILPNGPVHRAGKVRIGDILKKVDGKVVGDTVSSAKELLIGPLGSAVTLTVLRHSPFGMPDAISVCVVRGSAMMQGLERPDSGSIDRPGLPASYTPFAGKSSESLGVGRNGQRCRRIEGLVDAWGVCMRACSDESSCRHGRMATSVALPTVRGKRQREVEPQRRAHKHTQTHKNTHTHTHTYTHTAGELIDKIDEYKSSFHNLVRQYSGAPQAEGRRPSNTSSSSQQWLTEGAKARADGSLFAMLGMNFSKSPLYSGFHRIH